eukprot:CAMPEP_0181293744 /NCGR_PEP_ID=MMETSP1101-20121128/3225_1 /TAXON_ID=46948 /ORGANISM="Rhodomonas abbreviata, Strain Caron Lab Isolate" /LENGTH=227 /DNA_ID=CAMNT_0023398345 /DNA_START=307 /DNA_END=991 /DNA_ORIENTATION=-
MREARDAMQMKSKSATKKTKKMFGRVGAWAKSWMEPLRALEAGRPGKRRPDPLGLFDGSSEKEQIEKAKKVFAMIDKDQSGGVTEEELRMGLKEVFGFEAKKGQVERMMVEADENGDQKINLEEFLKVVSNYRKEQYERAMRIQENLEAANGAAPSVAQSCRVTKRWSAGFGAGGVGRWRGWNTRKVDEERCWHRETGHCGRGKGKQGRWWLSGTPGFLESRKARSG